MTPQADKSGPPPKRQRTGQGTGVPVDVAPANATIRLFTGMRQNSWMNANSDLPREEMNATSQVPATSGGETVGTIAASRWQRPQGPAKANTVPEIPRHWQDPTIPSALVGGEPGQARSGGQTGVGHDETALGRPSSCIAPRPPSVSVIRSSAVSRSIVGQPSASLPSPAASDDTSARNFNSPVTAATPLLLRDSASGVAAMPQQAPPQRAWGNDPRRTSRTSLDANQQRVPSQPAPYLGVAAPQQRLVVPSLDMRECIDPTILSMRIDAFESQRFGSTLFNNGRLTLLRDAVKLDDWFYIALSQLHSLAGVDGGLPPSIRRLNPACWACLDELLYSNQQLDSGLLDFLRKFPLSIDEIILSGRFHDKYSTYVQRVGVFLASMPAAWEGLKRHCHAMKSPPLAQDMGQQLGLKSPVLQTVIFRAIARGVWGTPPPQLVMEHLEKVHQWDQIGWRVHGRRWPAPAHFFAYEAYREVFSSGMNYLKKIAYGWQHQPPPLPTIPQKARMFFQPPLATSNPQSPMALDQSGLRGGDPNPPLYEGQVASHFTGVPSNDIRVGTAPLQGFGSAIRSPSCVSQGNVPLPLTLKSRHTPTLIPSEQHVPRPQPTQPDTLRSALHQAYLRSPKLAVAECTPKTSQMYRFIRSWVIAPRSLTKERVVSDFCIKLDGDDVQCLPITHASCNPGEPPTRVLDEGTRTYRLRCCATTTAVIQRESEWMTAENVWPDELFLSLNGHMLEMRRKLHHGRHLPIDITPFLGLGENILTATINRGFSDDRPFDFAIAAEVVHVVSHETIVNSIFHIPAEESLASIRKSLAGDPNDDEVAVVSSNLTITLSDPYTGHRIFDVPVRGRSCTHRDCFDLETFLSQCKRDAPGAPGAPTVVDCWRCPICRGDVRPTQMVVDGFLVAVRKELAAKYLLETRAIMVDADGSWSPRAEQRTGVRSPTLEHEEKGVDAAAPVAGARGAKNAVEVIELD